MAKKILIFVLIAIALVIAVIFIYRYHIIQYSAEALIRNSLPSYVRIDTISFKPQERKLVLVGFKILNPSGFRDPYLFDAGEVVCRYKMRGGSITDGIEILEPAVNKAVLTVERLPEGTLNLVKMQEEQAASAASKPGKEGRGGGSRGVFAGRKVSELIKLPETVAVRDGRMIFIDRLDRTTPHIIAIDNIQMTVTLKLNDSYSQVSKASSTGVGDFNGNRAEKIKWNIGLNPTTPRLSMSNRFEISDLSILPLEPYYDKYSPLIFKNGRCSGILVFDFDNGNIGSTNELHLTDVKFQVKPGYENATFWQTTVPDLVRYFTSPYGEIIFDFKIKGDMSSTKFYLGPISKQALTSLAIDKLSSAIKSASGSSKDGSVESGIEKAKEYIELFKGMVNKK